MSEETNHHQQDETEAPDEWTVLADTYTSVLVPSFAPIYDAVADYVINGSAKRGELKVLDFGCGPGEPTLTIARRKTVSKVVGVDSTRSMLDKAARRLAKHPEELSKNVIFNHVRRDVKMKDLSKTTGGDDTFDWVVSTFVLHYVEFSRRVELVSQFLKQAPNVLICSWGPDTKVGFLRAIKIFGTWKGGDQTKDISEVETTPEDDGTVETPRGSFTLCRKEAYQGIANQISDGTKMDFEAKTLVLTFSSVSSLLSFLPLSTNENDIQAMWRLLVSWPSVQVTLGDGPDHPLTFPTEVNFCHFSRTSKTKRNSEFDHDGESNDDKRSKTSQE